MESDSGSSWYSDIECHKWVALPVLGPQPPGHFEHGAAVDGEQLYIVGGRRSKRRLSSIWVFDMKSLIWSTIKPSTKLDGEIMQDGTRTESFPALCGHSMVKWGSKIFMIGGDDSDYVTVRVIDLESFLYGVIEATGKIPLARSGQSTSLVGSKLIMFGGKGKNRRLLNDVHVLDLETMTWNIVETIHTPPAPRSDHIATVHAGRYLHVFGGCTKSVIFNDLHVLDLETLEWSQPQIQSDLVSPRAGHAGVSIDEKWFIVGGGDNKSGASKTMVMDMDRLVISTLTNVNERDPLASEGLSLSLALINGDQFLVAYGGYNERYHNEVCVMRLNLKDYEHANIFQSPATVESSIIEESVGENSKTVMNDHEGETTVNNTLKYASLAFKIKNKLIVNNVGNRVGNRVGNMVGLRLQTMRYEIGSLKNIIETLQTELSKKEVDSIEEMNAMREEKRALEASVQEKDAVIETLRNEIEILQKKVQTILGKEKEVDHCECSSRATCVRGCECVQQNRLCSTSCSCIVRKCLNRDDKEKAEYAAKLLQNAAKGLVSEM
ncbi:acyl-CoA-binding domain-containing protein 6-like [Rutidosis leptorrhynchoides]|uniref:acyl-CoA-binding domain-containing protein 6-like n=1 Tax=Rutidosis leptorrhynchoides TaxID=125765 RepID=UPI003A98E028